MIRKRLKVVKASLSIGSLKTHLEVNVNSMLEAKIKWQLGSYSNEKIVTSKLSESDISRGTSIAGWDMLPIKAVTSDNSVYDIELVFKVEFEEFLNIKVMEPHIEYVLRIFFLEKSRPKFIVENYCGDRKFYSLSNKKMSQPKFYIKTGKFLIASEES